MSDFPEEDEETIVAGSARLARRSVLVHGASALIAAATVSVDDGASAQPASADDQVLRFVNLSAALTGIPNTSLLPEVDPIDLKREYFRFIKQQKETEPFDALLELAPAKNEVLSDSELADMRARLAAAGKRDERTTYLSRSITLLWYLGAWYAPSALKAHKESAGSQRPDFQIVSSNAYTHGWIWRVAQTHPMGYSDMQFGYWNSDPAPIASFGGPFK